MFTLQFDKPGNCIYVYRFNKFLFLFFVYSDHDYFKEREMYSNKITTTQKPNFLIQKVPIGSVRGRKKIQRKVTLNTKTNFVTTKKRKIQTDIDLRAKKQKLDVTTFIQDITDIEMLYLFDKLRKVNLKRGRSPIDSAYLIETDPIFSMVFGANDTTDNLDDIATAMITRLASHASVDRIKYANVLLVLASLIRYAFQSGDKPRDLLETLNTVPMHDIDDVQPTLPNQRGHLEKVMVGNNTVCPDDIRTLEEGGWLSDAVCVISISLG